LDPRQRKGFVIVVVELDDTAACADVDGGPASVFAAIAGPPLLPEPARSEIRSRVRPT
jgi:hypothetical protein